MKKLIIVCFLVLAFWNFNANAGSKLTATGNGLVLCPKDITNGLVGYWKLDEGTGTTIADSSGYGSHGTATGMTWDTDSQRGVCGSFDGVDDYVTIPDSTGTNIEGSRSVSLSVWIYPITQDGGSNYIIFKHRVVSGTNRGGFYLQNSSATPDFIISNNSNALVVTSPSTIGTTTWTHVCGVYNISSGGSALLYINGRLVASGTMSSGLGTHTATNVQLSAAFAAANINAKLDEASIYNRALSKREVLNLYLYSYSE